MSKNMLLAIYDLAKETNFCNTKFEICLLNQLIESIPKIYQVKYSVTPGSNCTITGQAYAPNLLLQYDPDNQLHLKINEHEVKILVQKTDWFLFKLNTDLVEDRLPLHHTFSISLNDKVHLEYSTLNNLIERGSDIEKSAYKTNIRCYWGGRVP